MAEPARQIENRAATPRLILLVDFRHPDIGAEEGHRQEFNWNRSVLSEILARLKGVWYKQCKCRMCWEVKLYPMA